jgi:hypothetical protein
MLDQQEANLTSPSEPFSSLSVPQPKPALSVSNSVEQDSKSGSGLLTLLWFKSSELCNEAFSLSECNEVAGATKRI